MTRARTSRTVLWLLLAAALFMRAFLPQGFMPERTDDGTITVRVCGSGHVLQIPAGKDEAPPESERAEPPCAFAGLGTPLLPPPFVADIPGPGPTEQQFVPTGETGPQVAVRLTHPPARGPPLAA